MAQAKIDEIMKQDTVDAPNVAPVVTIDYSAGVDNGII